MTTTDTELVKKRTISKPLPSQELLTALFVYDAETGKVYHRSTGAEAFTTVDPAGYRHGKVGRIKYQAHRIIWKMVTGADPDTIDHINHKHGDNRLVNLRDCSIAENSRNYAKPPGRTSKFRGVSRGGPKSKWRVHISSGSAGKFSLGAYASEIEAARAYDRAARELHGQFATLNFPDEAVS